MDDTGQRDSGEAKQITRRRGAEGVPVAIDDLLRRHLPALRVFVRLQAGERLRHRESCSDLVNSTCRELLERLDRFEYHGEAQFRQWLCTAALNKIRERARHHDAARRDMAREEAAELPLEELYRTLLTPSRVAIAREAVERLERAFDRLPEEHRQVILLCRVVGLPQDQVAQQMGKSVDAVRNLLHRALARVAGLADDEG